MKSFKSHIIIALLIVKIFTVYGGNLPPEIQKCKSTDNDKCIAKAIQEIFKLYPSGNSEFGVPNLRAINLKNLKISRSNPESPIQINFEFLNCTAYGLENLKIVRTSGFDHDLKNIVIDIFMPNLRVKGDYEISGKLLVLSLNGKGKGDIELKEASGRIQAKIEKEKREGKTYAKVKKIEATLLEPKQMLVNLENVLNGNTVVSESINNVINENWKDIWSELQEGINQEVGIIVKDIMSEVFNELPIDNIYSD